MLIDTWRRPSMLSPMCQDVARLQFDSCAQKQSLCGTVMMAWIWHVWINAIVFVPAAKAPPKARAKELLYSLDLIHELTSLFSPKVTFAGSLRKAFSQKHISGFLWLCKQRPRFAQGQPTGYFQLKKLDIKNFIEPRKLLSQWMTGGDSWMTPCTNMCPCMPACANIAVWQLCTEVQPLRNSHDSWWPELKMFGSMPWCLFPLHKLFPRLAQKYCCTVWIWSMSLHPCFAEDDVVRFA